MYAHTQLIIGPFFHFCFFSVLFYFYFSSIPLRTKIKKKKKWLHFQTTEPSSSLCSECFIIHYFLHIFPYSKHKIHKEGGREGELHLDGA